MIVDNKDPKNIQKFNQIIAQEILSQEDYDFCKAFDEGSVLPMFYHGWNGTYLNLDVYSEVDKEEFDLRKEMGI